MAGVLDTLTGIYREQMARHHNRPFLEAVMSAAALVCAADGQVTFPERMRLDQIIEAIKQLDVFDPHEAIDLFNDYTAAIQEDSKLGREAAFQRIEPVADNPETASLILRVCIGILEVEGEDNLTEQIEIVSLCSRLGIEPQELGLYVDELPHIPDEKA
jgi:tellurite resistance protein TerB